MRLAIWTLLCLLPMALVPAGAGELEDREAIRNQALGLFLSEQFGEIDRLAEQYRVEQSRTASGVWKLTSFYGGMGDVTRGLQGHYGKSLIEDVERRFQRWTAEYPDSIVAQIGYGRLLLHRAWLIRGHGWASQVAPDAWAPFRANLARARQHLMDHKRTASVDPEWYVIMLNVAVAEGWPQPAFQALLDEAVEAHPYYYEIYFQALEYFLPRWHGDIALVEEFANYAVEKTQDEEGMGMYARIYWFASQVQFGDRLYADTQMVWRKMAAGIDDVLARYPDQWNINNFAHFTCLAGDRKRALALLVRIEDAPIVDAWGGDFTNYGRCQEWAMR